MIALAVLLLRAAAKRQLSLRAVAVIVGWVVLGLLEAARDRLCEGPRRWRRWGLVPQRVAAQLFETPLALEGLATEDRRIVDGLVAQSRLHLALARQVAELQQRMDLRPWRRVDLENVALRHRVAQLEAQLKERDDLVARHVRVRDQRHERQIAELRERVARLEIGP